MHDICVAIGNTSVEYSHLKDAFCAYSCLLSQSPVLFGHQRFCPTFNRIFGDCQPGDAVAVAQHTIWCMHVPTVKGHSLCRLNSSGLTPQAVQLACLAPVEDVKPAFNA